MAKFLLMYRSNLEQERQAPSPEEMQAILAAWGMWMEKFKQSILDLGDGLLPTGRRIDAKRIVTDGPHVEGKDIVSGYSVIEASSYDDALVVAKECPILHGGGTIEMRELAGFA